MQRDGQGIISAPMNAPHPCNQSARLLARGLRVTTGPGWITTARTITVTPDRKFLQAGGQPRPLITWPR